MSGLTVDAATIAFEDTIAVDDVSLQVDAGQIFGLVGPSGCGKSTLLRAVAGLIDLDRGDIGWDGKSFASVPTHERNVGLMFQNHALFNHRTVAENIDFGLRMQGKSASDRTARVAELLALVGLEGFEDRSTEQLSGGEAQRVALARALAPTPRLLLLDEPLASLDRARRIELNAVLGRLLRELGQTAIYVTHDQEEAFAVADEVGVMNKGQILRTGTPGDVWRDPKSEFVARFVGHEAFVERNGRRYAVRADAVSLVQDGATHTGEVSGVVADCVFQGDRHQVGVLVEGQRFQVFSPDQVPVGVAVNLAIDEDRLAALDH